MFTLDKKSLLWVPTSEAQNAVLRPILGWKKTPLCRINTLFLYLSHEEVPLEKTIKAQHLIVAILNSSQFQGSNKLWRWQNCDNFLIFKIVSMPKIFKFCNLKHFNHRKNLKDWEIVTIWSNQIISTICLKVEIVKNLKLPQLGVVLWCYLKKLIKRKK